MKKFVSLLTLFAVGGFGAELEHNAPAPVIRDQVTNHEIYPVIGIHQDDATPRKKNDAATTTATDHNAPPMPDELFAVPTTHIDDAVKRLDIDSTRSTTPPKATPASIISHTPTEIDRAQFTHAETTTVPVIKTDDFIAPAPIVADNRVIAYSQLNNLTTLLPQSTDFYAIAEQVTLKEPYYEFQISSPHHPLYTVIGIADLVKTVAEISTMENYYSTPQGSEILTGVIGSITGTVEGAKQLVTRPGDSAVAVKNSVVRTGRSIKGFFKGLGKEEEKSSDGRNLEKGAGNALTAEMARKVAYELHLDSYTPNQYVRNFIGSIAARRAAGGMAFNAATTLVVPVAPTILTPATFVINGALTPGAFADRVEIMLRDFSPMELYQMLLKQMIANGYDATTPEYAALKAFLENPNYSPHNKAYLYSFLEKSGRLNALTAALQTLANADTVEAAENLFQQAQFLTALNGNKFTLVEYLADGKMNLLGKTAAGEIVAILPFDYLNQPLDWRGTIAFMNTLPAAPRSVGIIGTASDTYKQWLTQNGVEKIYENILHLTK